MKKAISKIIIIALIISLTACSKNDQIQNNSVEKIFNEGTFIKESELYYHPQFFSVIPDYMFVSGTFIHESKIYFYGPSFESVYQDNSIILYAMDINGSNLTHIQIPVYSEAYSFNIEGLHINRDGNLSFIIMEYFKHFIDLPSNLNNENDEDNFEFVLKIGYRNISWSGDLNSSIDIEQLNTFADNKPHFFINDVVFDDSNNIVFLVDWESVQGESFQSSILLLDYGFANDLRFIEEIPESLDQYLIKNSDGQIYVIGYQWMNNIWSSSLLEINSSAGIITDKLQISSEVRHITSAPKTGNYDFYSIENSIVYGYNVENKERHSILTTAELDIPYNPNTSTNNLAPFFVFDGDIILFLLPEWDDFLESLVLNFYLLTVSDEPFTDNRDVITIGGLGEVSSVLNTQLASYNRQNQNYKIEYINYGVDGLMRLQTEVMVGKGPDMFMLSWRGMDLVTPLAESGFLYNLYPLIDSDPILKREDFFPSIISSWENSHGELMQISPAFTIQTIIGRETEFPVIPDSWTYTDFISFYSDTVANHPAPLGIAFSRYDFLSKIVFTDDTFFSFEHGEAFFTNDAFISVLEAAKTIPATHNWSAVTELVREGEWDVIGNLLRGEQLLGAWQNIYDFNGFLLLKHRLGNFIPLGFPAQNTPLHGAQASMGNSVGINSNSSNVEAAWEFIRMGMLPDAMLRRGTFYTRIDLFEREMSRQLALKEPLPQWTQFGHYDINPLTEDDASMLREMINNIGHNLAIESPVYNIVFEEASRFFEGNRSAEDTARVIQNRVQTYLNEQHR